MNAENNNIDESENHKLDFSGRLIARNTFYNLLGYGIPLIFALVLIPPLISKLGTERFGVLNLIWMVVGYFSFFDFGFGKGWIKSIRPDIKDFLDYNSINDFHWFGYSFIIIFIYCSNSKYLQCIRCNI